VGEIGACRSIARPWYAFFYSPNPDALIECLPSCVGPGDAPRYPRAVYRDLVLEFYNANYFHRQGYTG